MRTCEPEMTLQLVFSKVQRCMACSHRSIEQLMAKYGYGLPGDSSEDDEDEEDDDDGDGSDEEDGSSGSGEGEEDSEGSSEEGSPVPVSNTKKVASPAAEPAKKRGKVEPSAATEAVVPPPEPTVTTRRSRGRSTTTAPVIPVVPAIIPPGWLKPDSDGDDGVASPIKSPKPPDKPVEAPAPAASGAPQRVSTRRAAARAPVATTEAPVKHEPSTVPSSPAVATAPAPAASPRSLKPQQSPPKQDAAEESPPQRPQELKPLMIVPIPVNLPRFIPDPSKAPTLDRPYVTTLEDRKNFVEGRLKELNEESAAASLPPQEPERENTHWDNLLAEMVIMTLNFVET